MYKCSDHTIKSSRTVQKTAVRRERNKRTALHQFSPNQRCATSSLLAYIKPLFPTTVRSFVWCVLVRSVFGGARGFLMQSTQHQATGEEMNLLLFSLFAALFFLFRCARAWVSNAVQQSYTLYLETDAFCISYLRVQKMAKLLGSR